VRILESEKITWKFSKPNSFPCFVCRVGEAVNRTTVVHREVRAVLSVCDRCNNFESINKFLMDVEGRRY